MTKRNPEYDFVWCPGCGDFGVRRALEMALTNYSIEHEKPQSENVVVAGIGCSGNMVHLLEGDQPFGIHGIHGRALPIAFGVKMGNTNLNTVVVAGDGDFLSIGAEHIGPAANRNVNMTAIVMDNGVYGLTKGQSSPTTDLGQITTSTPFGKIENSVIPLKDKILFKKPSNFSKPIAKIKKGKVLIVQKCEKKWCKIKTKKFKGWIKNKDVWGLN